MWGWLNGPEFPYKKRNGLNWIWISVIPADDPGIKKDLTDYLFSQLS